MILLDLSQLAMSSTYSFKKDFELGTANKENVRNILRHVILSQIKSYKKKFGQKYGEIVVCCDGTNYWRNSVFEFYKHNRRAAREASTLDWRLIFDTISEVIEDLRGVFPYKVIRLEGTESDDIIAVLTKHLFKNDPTSETLIVSGDKDFVQLQMYNNVTQFAPISKTFVISSDPHRALLEKIIKGDPCDGIPSVLCGDDFFVTPQPTRAKPITKKKLERFIDIIDNSATPTEEESNYLNNIKRNKTLIDFSEIPSYISENIINEFNKPIIGSKTKVFQYLLKHKLNMLLNDIENF